MEKKLKEQFKLITDEICSVDEDGICSAGRAYGFDGLPCCVTEDGNPCMHFKAGQQKYCAHKGGVPLDCDTFICPYIRHAVRFSNNAAWKNAFESVMDFKHKSIREKVLRSEYSGNEFPKTKS